MWFYILVFVLAILWIISMIWCAIYEYRINHELENIIKKSLKAKSND